MSGYIAIDGVVKTSATPEEWLVAFVAFVEARGEEACVSAAPEAPHE